MKSDQAEASFRPKIYVLQINLLGILTLLSPPERSKKARATYAPPVDSAASGSPQTGQGDVWSMRVGQGTSGEFPNKFFFRCGP